MPELDPRIISSIGDHYAALPTIAETRAQQQGVQLRDMAIAQQQQTNAWAGQDRAAGQHKQTRLAELLPGAGRGDRASIDAMYAVDPEMAGKMDERQREHAKAGVDDLSSAIIWAMKDPVKWNQMIDFYVKDHPEFEKYRDHMEYAPQALMALGKMGNLLEASKPHIITPQAGAGAFSTTPGLPNSGVTTLVAPNDGTQQTGAPVSGGALPMVTDGPTYNAVPPGGMYQTLDGHTRQKPGGPTPQASAPFPR